MAKVIVIGGGVGGLYTAWRMAGADAEPVEAETRRGCGVEQVSVAWIRRHGRAALLLITERAVPGVLLRY